MRKKNFFNGLVLNLFSLDRNHSHKKDLFFFLKLSLPNKSISIPAAGAVLSTERASLNHHWCWNIEGVLSALHLGRIQATVLDTQHFYHLQWACFLSNF